MRVSKLFLCMTTASLMLIALPGCGSSDNQAPSKTSTSGVPRTQADFDQQIEKARASDLPADQKQKVIQSLTTQRDKAPVN